MNSVHTVNQLNSIKNTYIIVVFSISNVSNLVKKERLKAEKKGQADSLKHCGHVNGAVCLCLQTQTEYNENH